MSANIIVQWLDRMHIHPSLCLEILCVEVVKELRSSLYTLALVSNWLEVCDADEEDKVEEGLGLTRFVFVSTPFSSVVTHTWTQNIRLMIDEMMKMTTTMTNKIITSNLKGFFAVSGLGSGCSGSCKGFGWTGATMSIRSWAARVNVWSSAFEGTPGSFSGFASARTAE